VQKNEITTQTYLENEQEVNAKGNIFWYHGEKKTLPQLFIIFDWIKKKMKFTRK
jgi:hypothetical protein